MTAALHHDVVVLGGGPAGSGAAISLARLGYDVAQVERVTFPRPNVGICLADQTLALLDHLDAGDAFRSAGFWRRGTTAVRWAQENVRFVEQAGYHVDRGVFDSMLLERARAAGVTIYQPARLDEIRSTGSTGWEGRLTCGGSVIRLSSSFLVDAAGRRSALAGARIKDGPPLLALHSAWRLGRPPRFDGMIASGLNGWAWYARTGTDQAIVSIFVDPGDARAGGRDRLTATYGRLLEQFSALTDALRGSIPGRVQACDAGSTHASDPVGERFIRVGDAAMSVDPLSSQGVHLALQSGIQAAIVANTILRRPGSAALSRQFYRDRVNERVDQFVDRTRTEYARGAEGYSSTFWRRRGGAPIDRTAMIGAALRKTNSRAMAGVLTLANDASLICGPVIVNDFVEERAMLAHPTLPRPIAYVGGVEIGALLACIPKRFSLDTLPLLWRDHLDAWSSRQLASWLWQHRVIVDVK